MTRQLMIVAAVAGICTAAPAQAASHWGYSGDGAPAKWGELDPENKACAVGAEQSPIDLVGRTVAASGDKMKLDWKAGPFKVVNNGHTIEAEAPAGSTITLDGKVLELKQFHFHLPSEHVRDGKHAAMEVHFVHKDASGAAAVVGVMMTAGASNAVFHKVMAVAPAKPDAGEQEVTLDPKALLPKGQARYRYEGSLTTPPCSEVVDWQVMASSITVAKADIDKFRAIIGENARPVQPRGRRFVLKVAN